MRRILSMTMLLTLVACALVRAETRRAVVIGIDDYLSPRDNLAGAVNDAQAVASLLETERFGFTPRDVVRLLNAEATRERILAEMRRVFLEASAPGDLAVFYVASHGSQMQNRLSPELDKLDETIVPYPRPTRAEIRDKEFGKILEGAARKGVRVTAILDSCHSGSMERGLSRQGRMRALAPDPRAVAADPSTPDPVAAGALMLSAAQDFQTAAETVDASGTPHGAFTIALLQALREAPVDEPAAQFLLRVRAILQRDGSVQEPWLAAGPGRLRGPLFGGAGRGGRLAVAVRSVSGSVVDLQGGKAIGLAPGAVLARREGKDLGPVGLKAKTVELTRSQADVVEGDAQTVRAGQLFDVKKWAAQPGASLRIHVPPGRPATEVRSAAARFAALKQSSSLRWVEDPAQLSPTHVLVAQEKAWLLRFPDGREVNLGAAPAAADVEHALSGAKGVAGRTAPCDTMPCLYIRLPPATELLEKITVGKEADEAVRRVDDPQSHYVLGGRLQGDKLQYAWVLAAPPAKPGEKAPPLLPLPARSTWIELGEDPAVASASLEELVLRIGRARDWLTLESPPDTGVFPYRLALVNRESKGVVESGAVVQEGETYNLQLRAEPAALKSGGIERRYIYVISVDNAGTIQVLYPRPGVTETRFPVVAEGEDLPVTQPIGGANAGLKVVEPFGKDTYVLVASREAIPNLIDIEQEAVMRGRPMDRGPESGLSRLLRSTGARTRGQGAIDDVDPDWNIQRVEVESRPQSPPPERAPCQTGSVEELEYELWCHTLQATRLADKPKFGYVPEPPPQECYVLPEGMTQRPGVARMSVREVTEYLGSLHGRRPAVLFHAQNPSARRFCTWLLTAEGVAASEAAPMEEALQSLGSGLSFSLDLPARESGRVADPRGVELVGAGPVSLPETATRLLPPKVAKGLIAHLVDTLIVVPIYDVGAVPFAALSLDGQPLIERMSVLIAPSFQSFERPPRPWDGSPMHPLVLGDPRPAGGPALKGALSEATEVAKEVGARLLVHGDAAAAGIRDWLLEYPDTNFVHIAAHGIAKSEDADRNSGLFLADRFWSAEDVWNIALAPGSLVVLSACQSGLGKHYEMGTASVARAFHHDGASAVVMSLWNVDDEATRKLMVAFTKNAFKKGNPVPPDRALREAMLELRNTDPDPLHWAGFNVFGLPAPDR